MCLLGVSSKNYYYCDKLRFVFTQYHLFNLPLLLCMEAGIIQDSEYDLGCELC